MIWILITITNDSIITSTTNYVNAFKTKNDLYFFKVMNIIINYNRLISTTIY